jgi:hemerythrin-like domain-containing protein
MSTMQPLRDEHRELRPHIDAIKDAADAVGSVPAGELRARVSEVSEFLRHHLIPHAKAEEAVLYPEVERALAAPRATAVMSRDHVEVARLTAELVAIEARLGEGEEPSHLQADARRVLYGLYALLQLHFAEEEEIYVPILEEALDTDRARNMFERMHAAAERARQPA